MIFSPSPRRAHAIAQWYARSVDSTSTGTGKRVLRLRRRDPRDRRRPRSPSEELGLLPSSGLMARAAHREMAREVRAAASRYGVGRSLLGDHLLVRETIAALQPDFRSSGTRRWSVTSPEAARAAVRVVSAPAHVQDHRSALLAPQMGIGGANGDLRRLGAPRPGGARAHLLDVPARTAEVRRSRHVTPRRGSAQGCPAGARRRLRPRPPPPCAAPATWTAEGGEECRDPVLRRRGERRRNTGAVRGGTRPSRVSPWETLRRPQSPLPALTSFPTAGGDRHARPSASRRGGGRAHGARSRSLPGLEPSVSAQLTGFDDPLARSEACCADIAAPTSTFRETCYFIRDRMSRAVPSRALNASLESCDVATVQPCRRGRGHTRRPALGDWHRMDGTSEGTARSREAPVAGREAPRRTAAPSQMSALLHLPRLLRFDARQRRGTFAHDLLTLRAAGSPKTRA